MIIRTHLFAVISRSDSMHLVVNFLARVAETVVYLWTGATLLSALLLLGSRALIKVRFFCLSYFALKGVWPVISTNA